jgi:hypothetical protein
MPIGRFAELLDQSSLHFSRADSFDDPFEGSVPRLTYESRLWFEKNALLYTGGHMSGRSDFRRGLLRRVSVSCGHENPGESAAMWKIYAPGRNVAIRTTSGALVEALEAAALHVEAVGRVRYIDFEEEFAEDFDWISPFFWKRRSYNHEFEVRALVYGDGRQTGPDVPEVTGGVNVPIRLSSLLQAVHVYPAAEDWLLDCVQQLVRRSGLDIEVQRSLLDKDPFF